MEEEIRAACSELRAILELKKNEIADEGYLVFRGFPSGCCEKTTHLLAHYLIYKGLCQSDDMRMPWNNHDREGEWGGASHGWISLANGLNVDITADQFSGIDDTVIVSNDHHFHRRFIRAEWVNFDEHHRRVTWQDDGETFRRIWRVVTQEA
jgi:hypothetical protein